MADFILHPRLAGDTLGLGDLPLSRVLLMNDSRFPWLILVPKRIGVTELHQLSIEDQQQLLAESNRAARALLGLGCGEKINLGVLGNLVPQLHWHLVVRSQEDPCWPGPVWGCGTPRPYTPQQQAERAAALKLALQLD